MLFTFVFKHIHHHRNDHIVIVILTIIFTIKNIALDDIKDGEVIREEAFFSKKEIVPQNQIVPPNHPNLVGSVNFDPFVLFMPISWQLDTTQDFQGFCWTSRAQIIKHGDNDGSGDDGAPLVMMMVMMVVVKITFITIIINISLKDCLHTLMTSNYLFCQKSLFQPISKFSKEVGNAIHGTGENDGNKE